MEMQQDIGDSCHTLFFSGAWPLLYSHWQSSGTVWDTYFLLDVILQLFDRVRVTSHEAHKLEKQQNQRSTISNKLSMRLAASKFSKGLRMVA